MTNQQSTRQAFSSGIMNSTAPHLGSVLTVIGLGLAMLLHGCDGREKPSEPYAVVDRKPKMWPDYGDVTVPANIAPLNFVIQEPGAGYFVRVHAANDKPIECKVVFK